MSSDYLFYAGLGITCLVLVIYFKRRGRSR